MTAGLDLFRMLAAYNAWANARLYAVACDLAPDELRADRGVFFRSLLGTFNHLLVADRIWMRRFTGEGDAPTRLDAVLFEDLSTLDAARRAEDARIVAWIGGLSEDALSGRVTYRTISDPQVVTQPLASALTHFFNHQTHHRGQAHAVLTGLGREVPSLDLIQFQREARIGLA